MKKNYRDNEDRINELLYNMTLEEKISQMRNRSVDIERLGIPYYNWSNEALHGGVGRAGIATVFPQAIGMGGHLLIKKWCSKLRQLYQMKQEPSIMSLLERTIEALTKV